MAAQSMEGDPSASTGTSMDYSAIVQDTARGILYFAGGQALQFLVGLAGAIFLSRLLSPRDFGIYAIISFVVLSLNALGDLGLNANLIHDDNPPSYIHQRSIFTMQCLIALTVYTALYFLADWLASLFQLGDDAGTFFRAVGLMILLQPFQTIPVGLLRRWLRYDRLTLAEFASSLVYQIAVITLAFLNFSYWSFGIAALLSTTVRTALLSAWCRWHIGLAWDSAYLGRCVRFGGAFQLSSLTAVARDNIITFLGGPLFGPSVVGLLNWSQRLAAVCTQTYVGVCARISFPSLSRMRSNPRLFIAALTRMLRYVNLATFLTLSVVAALAEEIVHLVFTDKWAPAIPLFYYFAIRMVAANYITLLDGGLQAQGHPGRSLKILSLWTAGEWGLALVGVALLGHAGIAISNAVAIWFALAWLYRELSQLVSIDLWRASATPLLCGAVTFLALYWGKGQRIDTLPALLFAMLGGGLVYAFVGVLAEGRRFCTDIKADIAVVLSPYKHSARLAMRVRD